MTYTPQPEGTILDKLERLRRKGGKRWRDADGCLYEWDPEHGGEVEKYTKSGIHMGVLDKWTGELIKLPKRGRTIDV